MGIVVEIENPFEPHKARVSKVESPVSIRTWLENNYPGFTEFAYPTICIYNGKPLLRREWNLTVVRKDDIVCFQRQVAGFDPFTWFIYAVIALGAALLAVNLMPGASVGSIQDADSVHSLNGQTNQNKRGQPVECPYGRNTLWPSLASERYVQFKDNDQYLFLLLCLGVGTYDDIEILVEQTPITEFDGVEFAIYAPGETVTLFPDNVYTVPEVASIELLAPNNEEFASWSGPFAVVPAGQTTTRIEIDVGLLKGLFFTDKKGNLQETGASSLFEIQEIDDNGNAVGDWIHFHYFTASGATTTPLRYTVSKDVVEGRYQMRAIRDFNEADRYVNSVYWLGVRSFLPPVQAYNDVTVVALKIKATGALNDRSQNRINVKATRKLPVYNADTGQWSSPTATRSPVWAFCDVYRAAYGGNLPASALNLSHLAQRAGEFEDAGKKFDWVFDYKLSLWEASAVAARCGRAFPTLNGAQLDVIVDEPATLPTAVFTKENIVKGSFELSTKFFTDDEYDGAESYYHDPLTNQEKSVLVLVNGEAGDVLEDIRIPGLTDPLSAFREGYYERAKKVYLRQVLSFRAGLEAYIPERKKLVLVAYPMPKWGLSGVAEEVTVANGQAIVVSKLGEQMEAGEAYVLGFRDAEGGLLGPYDVVEYDDNAILIQGEPDTLRLRFSSQGFEGCFIIVGTEESKARLCKVESIEPSEGEEVSVKVFIDDQRIFEGDTVTPPEAQVNTLPAVPELPVVASIIVQDVPSRSSLIQVSWPMALGADHYVLESSYNGGEWSRVTTTSETFYQMPVLVGPLRLRVAGVNVAKGPWSPVWQGNVGEIGLVVPESSNESVVLSKDDVVNREGTYAQP